MRRERSEEKEEVEGIVVRGTRVSFSIVMRRPRWDSVETRVWNAVCSSLDAEKLLVRMVWIENRIKSYLIFRTAS